MGVIVLSTAWLLGCNKETPPAAEEPRSASNATAPQPAPAAAGVDAASAPAAEAAGVSGKPKVSGEGFDVSLEAPKLKLKETPGVKYENLTIGKDAVKLENMKAVVPVSFTPEAGKRTIAGTLAFSVCTDDKCLMEKQELALEVVAE
jgi:hypothetical protein